MAAQTSEKSPWADKFVAPTVDQIRGHYNRQTAQLFDSAREVLGSLPGLAESIAWQGVPWRWTLVYSVESEGTQGGVRAWAYIVPDPQRLQVCVPLSGAMLAAMPVKRFKKWVRDGIVFARSVGGVCWPTWEIATREHMEDVADIIRRKHRQTVAPVDQAHAVGA